jgi:putative oxidoreductase
MGIPVMHTDTSGEPKPLIPALGRLYRYTPDISYLIIRVAVGGILLAHGVMKLMGSSIAVFAAGSLARRGVEPALPLAYVVWFLETVGATCLILGLFTRFFAAAIAIELLVLTIYAAGPNGFTFSSPGGGWEFPFMWGLIVFAIALRGGGPYSLDRKIGWEL